MSDKSFEDLIETAHALADAARVETLKYFRGQDLATTNKSDSDFDPVTKADRATEAAMRAILAKRRPDDGILGEEYENFDGTSGLTWVLDPIDGTRGFLSGAPTWGVLIAVSDDTGPKFGMIDQPFIGERFIGGFGLADAQGPHGPSKLETRGTTQLSDAILYSTYPEVGTPDDRAAFERVSSQVQLTRFGTDCYAYGLLAMGHIDLVIEAGLQPYDIQAPIAVVQAAGGIVTDWTGGPAHNGGRAIAAANPEIHAAAMALLQE